VAGLNVPERAAAEGQLARKPSCRGPTLRDGFVGHQIRASEPALEGRSAACRRQDIRPVRTLKEGGVQGALGTETREEAMKVVQTIAETRAAVQAARAAEKTIGFVPTMGALHAGHLSLIDRARRETGFVVVSIFVNPTQFGPNEDFDRYPRPFQHDVKLCSQHGVDLVFAPSGDEMYPPGYGTYVDVTGVTDRFEGICRPSHFRGVTTVVAKLFNIVQPDVAYFGQKDAQQAAVIRKMVQDLNYTIRIVVCPTVRDPDGLAVSSRNVYLSPEERKRALALSRALFAARDAVKRGTRDVGELRELMWSTMEKAGVDVDYADVVDPDSFEPLAELTPRALAIVAGLVGTTRLIDNLPLFEEAEAMEA